MSLLHVSTIAIALLGMPGAAAAGPETARITVLENAQLSYDPDLPDPAPQDEYVLRDDGRMAEVAVDLPPAPSDHRNAMRITATLDVRPVLVEHNGGYRPGDPWPRLGSVSVMSSIDGDLREVELMRFVTGFGGAATYTQDLTALAPLLHGPALLRVDINTYMDPAWDVSLTLEYTPSDAGFRRPALAATVFNERQVTAENSIVRASITVPDGLSRPRVRVLSTGHATDGRGGDEFIPRTHILRIDGEEIARWKPWAEHGHVLRELNPASGRAEIDGRELWSSDFDRSGWHPSLVVVPLFVPAPELSPGEHEIELEILDIRPADVPAAEENADDPPYGYWRVSAIVLADEPWPGRPGVRRGGREEPREAPPEEPRDNSP